jgi:DNA-binding response OmpR family regulator
MKRILVVDDIEAVCRALKSLLSAPGVEVDTAGSLEEEKSLLDRLVYDALVTDRRLSDAEGSEGLELVRLMRDRGLHTIAVLVTGYDRREYEATAATLGCAVLEKPVDPRVLLDILSPTYATAVQRARAFGAPGRVRGAAAVHAGGFATDRARDEVRGERREETRDAGAPVTRVLSPLTSQLPHPLSSPAPRSATSLGISTPPDARSAAPEPPGARRRGRRGSR